MQILKAASSLLKGKEAVLKRRKNVNAITLTGHFATWVAKLAVIVSAGSTLFFYFIGKLTSNFEQRIVYIVLKSN